MKISILSAIILILFSNSVFAKSLNIYSHRQPYLLKPFLDAYTKKTGVKLNVVYSSKGLAHFVAKNKGLEYFIALEPDSVFGS